MILPNWLQSSRLMVAAILSAYTILNVEAFVHPSFSGKIGIQPKILPIQTISKVRDSNLSQFHMTWGNDDEISGGDRVKSCIPYILPLLDGDQFGRYIYQRVPPLNILDQIFLQPILSFYHAIPFLGIGLFILFSLGTRNPEISRSIRFNTQQAILIDIALIFPEILGSVTPNMPRLVVEPATNFVYYTYVACVLYSIVSNLTGKKPNQIPVISEAAEMAVGPM